MNEIRFGGHTKAPHRHRWQPARPELGDEPGPPICIGCGKRQSDATRRNRNNRLRGGKAELETSKVVNGRKVGPLGLPWDVEMVGYARLQVRKLLTPESLRAIARELNRIGTSPSGEMPGYIWIQPGRGGERLIVFRLHDFADRHGVPRGDPDE